MKPRVSHVLSITVLTLGLAVGLGCAKAPNDAELTGAVQTRFSQDSGLSAKSLNVQAANGTVTLTGAVDNEMQRDAAARQAAAVPGVKEVINNLQVAAPTPSPVAETLPPAQIEEKPAPAPAPAPKARPSAGRPKPKPVSTTEVAQAAAPALPQRRRWLRLHRPLQLHRLSHQNRRRSRFHQEPILQFAWSMPLIRRLLKQDRASGPRLIPHCQLMATW